MIASITWLTGQQSVLGDIAGPEVHDRSDGQGSSSSFQLRYIQLQHRIQLDNIYLHAQSQLARERYEEHKQLISRIGHFDGGHDFSPPSKSSIFASARIDEDDSTRGVDSSLPPVRSASLHADEEQASSDERQPENISLEADRNATAHTAIADTTARTGILDVEDPESLDGGICTSRHARCIDHVKRKHMSLLTLFGTICTFGALVVAIVSLTRRS